MEKYLIEVKNLNFNYERNTILYNSSFSITKGENIGILGRNGGGKSTLIKLILGFLKPSSGTIEYHIESHRSGKRSYRGCRFWQQIRRKTASPCNSDEDWRRDGNRDSGRPDQSRRYCTGKGER